MIMKEDKGKWEEIIRSKIYDFEVETIPEDWESLSAVLADGKTVRLIPYRKIFFTAAAVAAVVALVIIGGLSLFTNREKTPATLIATESNLPQTIENGVVVEKPVENIVEKPVENLLAVLKTPEKKTVEPGLAQPEEILPDKSALTAEESDVSQIQEWRIDDQPVENDDLIQIEVTDNQPVNNGDFGRIEEEALPEMIQTDRSHKTIVTSETKPRRWGFGVGTGSISTGSNSGNPTIMTTSRLLRPDEYVHDRDMISLRSSRQNATLLDPLDGIELQSDNTTGKVKHKTPISGGLGISYFLSDRWALQSGAVYTFLRSKGSNIDELGNPASWKQNLHFIGVPLSASYSIAEWNRINFYVSAGGMVDWNVAGQIKRTAQVEGLDVINSEKLRMKVPIWSVNTRAGAVYPVWKFVNLYAEAGAAYYFDNKSSIVTIRSDKPFNVSLQAGLRLGF